MMTLLQKTECRPLGGPEMLPATALLKTNKLTLFTESHSLPTSPYHPCSHQSIFCIWICLFGTFRINGLLQYVIVCDWLLSCNITFSGSHCSVVRTSFFFMAGQYSTFCLCNHLYKCWGFLYYLAIISNDATNILVNFWACMFSYLLSDTRSGLSVTW